MGQLDASIAWSTEGLEGSHKFLERVYRLITEKTITAENDGKLDRVYNETVKFVTEHLDALKFNTAISQLMIFVNAANKLPELPLDYAKGFIQLLAPFAPHLGEELWQTLTGEAGISYVAWPTFDDSKLQDDEIEIVLQVLGKNKAKVMVPTGASKDELEKIALENDVIKDLIAGKTVRKVIAVPDKLVNIVAN